MERLFPKGWLHFEAPVPPQLGTHVYVQAAVISLASPGFPLQVTNLQDGIIVFRGAVARTKATRRRARRRAGWPAEQASARKRSGARRSAFAALFGEAPVNDLFGYRLVSRSRGRAVIAMRVRREWLQQSGFVQGGVVAALTDTAAMAAIYPDLPPGHTTATIEFKLNFVRPALPRAGEIVARSRLLSRGSKAALCEVDVRQGRSLVAKSLYTYLVYPVQQDVGQT